MTILRAYIENIKRQRDECKMAYEYKNIERMLRGEKIPKFFFQNPPAPQCRNFISFI